jgi:hypothetical protein
LYCEQSIIIIDQFLVEEEWKDEHCTDSGEISEGTYEVIGMYISIVGS